MSENNLDCHSLGEWCCCHLARNGATHLTLQGALHGKEWLGLQCREHWGWNLYFSRQQALRAVWFAKNVPLSQRMLPGPGRQGDGKVWLIEDSCLPFQVLNKAVSAGYLPRAPSPHNVLSEPCLPPQAPFKAEQLATCSQTHSREWFHLEKQKQKKIPH